MPVKKRIVPPEDLIGAAISSAMHGYQNLDTLASCIGRIIDTEAWRHASLKRRPDRPYSSFWDWVTWKLPDGMETTEEKLIAMLAGFPEVHRKALGLTPKARPEEGGAPEGNKNASKEKQPGVTHSCFADKKSAQGILARLKRDHPQIAQAFIEGEYPSAAAAGRAAGIPWLQPKTPLQKVLALIPKLSSEDRDAVRRALT